jgi:hypothetical protein
LFYFPTSGVHLLILLRFKYKNNVQVLLLLFIGRNQNRNQRPEKKSGSKVPPILTRRGEKISGEQNVCHQTQLSEQQQRSEFLKVWITWQSFLVFIAQSQLTDKHMFQHKHSRIRLNFVIKMQWLGRDAGANVLFENC